jgi:hypothetical protein
VAEQGKAITVPFEVNTVVAMKSTIVSVVHVVQYKVTGILEEHTASAFRVEEKAKQAQFCLLSLFNYLKMEAVCSSKTLELLYYTAPHLRR